MGPESKSALSNPFQCTPAVLLARAGARRRATGQLLCAEGIPLWDNLLLAHGVRASQQRWFSWGAGRVSGFPPQCCCVFLRGRTVEFFEFVQGGKWVVDIFSSCGAQRP